MAPIQTIARDVHFQELLDACFRFGVIDDLCRDSVGADNLNVMKLFDWQMLLLK